MAGQAQAAIVLFQGFDAGSTTPGLNATAAAATFDLAAANATLVDFESDLPIGFSVSGGGVSIASNVSSTPNHSGGNTTPGGEFYVRNIGGDPLFTFTTPISAFGAYFGGINLSATLSFTDSTGLHSIFIPGDNVVGGYRFVGFTDAGESITSVQLDTTADVSSVDDVRFGPAGAVSPSPEPSVWAMLIAGFGLTGAALRRRTRRSAA